MLRLRKSTARKDAPGSARSGRAYGRFTVFAAGAAAVCGAALVWRKRRESLRYRSEALIELGDLTRKMRDAKTRPEALAALPDLLGRACEAMVDPAVLKGMSGQEWLDLLDSTWPGGSFSDGPGRVLATLKSSNRAGLQAVSAEQAAELAGLARRWIREHRLPFQPMASAESRS